MKRLIGMALVAQNLGLGFAAADVTQGAVDAGQAIVEAFPETVPALAATEDSEKLVPVSLSMSQAFQVGVDAIVLEAVTRERLHQADAEYAESHMNVYPPPQRVGITRPIEIPIDVQQDAELTELADGSFVRTLAIQSPGALRIRVRFSDFDIGDNELLYYTSDGDETIVHGPYAGKGPERDGDFWTPSLPGATAYIEVVGNDESRFTITEIVHFDRDPGLISEDGGSNGNGVFACHLDVTCEPAIPATIRNAVGQMNMCDGNGNCGVCSGTLLNDLDGETVVPYFLTARHCLNTQAEVDNLEVVWLWQADACNGNLPNFNSLPRNTGGTLVRTYGENDMTFIRLAGALPGGLGLAGWTTSTSVSNAYGVHHPSGTFKRAVLLDAVGVCPGCTCVDGTDYDYYNMEDGLVEGGSSGSPVFNGSGQVAGQLRGRCGFSSHPDNMHCGNIGDYWAVYGEFETTYDEIAYWLVIGGTMHVDVDFVPGIIPELGTPDLPFNTLGEAVNVAWDGLRIKMQDGNYSEALTIDKQLALVAANGPVIIGE